MARTLSGRCLARAPPPICGVRVDVVPQMEGPTVSSRLRTADISMRSFFMAEIHSEVCHCLPRDTKQRQYKKQNISNTVIVASTCSLHDMSVELVGSTGATNHFGQRITLLYIVILSANIGCKSQSHRNAKAKSKCPWYYELVENHKWRSVSSSKVYTTYCNHICQKRNLVCSKRNEPFWNKTVFALSCKIWVISHKGFTLSW